MQVGASNALALVRVERDAPRPSDEQLRQALDRDRGLLNMPPMNGTAELAVAGPYQIIVDGKDVDEYAVWDR